MLTPLPLGLGLRYVRARQHQYFVSFISWVSLAGICLGVAALIAILSVMNGFEGELRTRLLALAAHATLPAPADPAALRRSRPSARASEAGVASAEPFIEVQGLLSNGATLAGAVLRGIDAKDHGPGSALAAAMRQGAAIGARAREPARCARPRAGLPVAGAHRRPRQHAARCAAARTAHSRRASGHSKSRASSRSASPTMTRRSPLPRSRMSPSLAGPSATAGIRVFYADPFEAPTRTPAARGRARHAGRHRLDAGARRLFPGDPARKNDDDGDPAPDRRGGRLQHHREPRHGRVREAQRHRDPAHARLLARRRGRDVHRARAR